MLKKSFFNPFSIVLLALALVSLASDVLLAPSESRALFTPVVLLVMWVAGGLVRFAYEIGAKRNFQRHMARSAKRHVLKSIGGLWVFVEPSSLNPGDTIRLGSGDVCPVDAVLSDGSFAIVSEAPVTGESGFSTMRPGDAIAAGTTIVDGKAAARVTSRYQEAPVRHKYTQRGYSEGARDICLVLIRAMFVIAPVALLVHGLAMGEWGDALLFAVSAAVGLVPEMLPVVTSICLSGGARRLKSERVIVKDVDSMESLGSVDVICMDKTGTLTSDKASLEYFTDIIGNEDIRTLELAYLECSSHDRANSQLDEAVLEACASDGVRLAAHGLGDAFNAIETDPFEHGSKFSGAKLEASSEAMSSIGIKSSIEDSVLTVVKGEVEGICQRCAWADFKGQKVPMDADGLAHALSLADDMRSDGIKVLAVAYGADVEEWENLTLCGFLAFFDAPKKSALAAVESLASLGVKAKILTGDSAAVASSVCGRLGIPTAEILTGSDVAKMSEDELLVAADRTSVFAELSPLQKAQIVSALRQSGRTVGYLGDGLNDLPAIQASDVGVVVDSAVSEAKAVADVVLEQKDLAMVARGVEEGRRAFANATKYIRIASSSNFGNVCSVAIASLLLPFLPAVAGQLLVLNLVYDATCIALTVDRVGAEETSKPRTWSGRGLTRFMLTFGPVSTAFDLLTFALLLLLVCPQACGGAFFDLDAAGQAMFVAMFQAGWLLECAWTQSLVILALRAGRASARANRPCAPLAVAVGLVLAMSALLLATPLAGVVGMVPVPAWFLLVVGAECAVYLLVVALAKRWFLGRHGRLF
ncbi:MAG: HAD family hydrolase [Coriobacteriaceae bacterium]|nr:HAD family hydrolase [Coriobacteriaceae bacterium]